MGVNTITFTEATTHPIRIDINTTVAKGYFTGHARIRSQAELDELKERLDAGDYNDDEERLMRDLYEKFDGFGDSDGFKELLDPDSKAAPYMRNAAATAYFGQWAEARKGNSRTQRKR